MHHCKKNLLFCFLVVLYIQLINAEPDPNFHIYLLFGQSNMAGPCNNDNATPQARDPQPEDCDTTSRVQVLAWGDYARASKPCGFQMNRTHDQWYTAFPPYHNQHEGLGPADYFGKTLLDSIREDIKIGFVPCALSGQKIEVFMKGRNYPIDSHTQPTIGGGQKLQRGGYEWMVKRAKIAQETGVIKGILLHQGEANAGDGDSWVTKVKSIYDDLKADLGLDDIPFIAGELIQDPVADQNAKRLNPFVNKIAQQLPLGGVASSKDLTMRSGDTWRLHFSCDGIRELGRRYAKAFLELADQEWVPRIGTVKTKWQPSGALSVQQVIQRNEMVNIFSLDGKKILSVQSKNINSAKNMLQSGKVYLLKWNTTGRCNTMVGF